MGVGHRLASPRHDAGMRWCWLMVRVTAATSGPPLAVHGQRNQGRSQARQGCGTSHSASIKSVLLLPPSMEPRVNIAAFSKRAHG